MKVKVIEPFLDKYDIEKKYLVGDVLDVDEERGRNLVVRGLVQEEISLIVEDKIPVKKGRKKKTE